MTLKLEKITKQVGASTHLYEMDLELGPGLNVLIGPTLAGKTSLLRLMAGLDKPTTGRILMDGRDITHERIQKRRVAMVYQQFINYPSFTVYNNIASPLKRAALSKQEIDRKVRDVAAMLKLEPLLERLPDELSGGQQQRTALARALVKDADLLLLDEPLINLDYKLREELRSELQQVFKHRRRVVVYATTEPLEALMLSGTTVVLDQGRRLQVGPTAEVFHNPASVRVGEVFSDPPMNLIRGRVEDSEAKLGDSIRVPLAGHLAGLKPGAYRFGLRANDLFIRRTQEGDVEFTATVELAEISGSETFVHAAFDGTSWVAQEEGVHPLGLGESIRVFLKPANLFAFDTDGQLRAAPARTLPQRGAL
jgi:glycerol transport system ATP-binding protein